MKSLLLFLSTALILGITSSQPAKIEAKCKTVCGECRYKDPKTKIVRKGIFHYQTLECIPCGR